MKIKYLGSQRRKFLTITFHHPEDIYRRMSVISRVWWKLNCAMGYGHAAISSGGLDANVETLYFHVSRFLNTTGAWSLVRVVCYARWGWVVCSITVLRNSRSKPSRYACKTQVIKIIIVALSRSETPTSLYAARKTKLDDGSQKLSRMMFI